MVKKGCFFIAEAGVNHNGDLSLAKRLVDAACKAGVDAVKFQTFKTENLVVKNAPKAGYQIQNTDKKESQFKMLKKLELSFEEHRILYQYCRQRGILFLSTPFDEASVDFLDALGVERFKVSSGELTNLPLLATIARKKKPMIVSTGMATLEEVGDAVRVIQESGHKDITLLHCVSSYPALPQDVNLRAMLTLKETFGLPVGYSDHTQGIEVALAAVALGAVVIEKHFTLNRNLPGPDHKASLEPEELAKLAKGVRIVEEALGNGKKKPSPSELDVARVARKSLTADRRIPKGSVLQKKWIVIKRPGTGLKPGLLDSVVGLKAKRDIAEGEVLTWKLLER